MRYKIVEKILLSCTSLTTATVCDSKEWREISKEQRVELILDTIQCDDNVRVFTNQEIKQSIANNRLFVWRMFCEANNLPVCNFLANDHVLLKRYHQLYDDQAWPKFQHLNTDIQQLFANLGNVYEEVQWFELCIYKYGIHDIRYYKPDQLERFMRYYLHMPVQLKKSEHRRMYEPIISDQQHLDWKNADIKTFDNKTVQELRLMKATSLLLGSMVCKKTFKQLINIR